MEELIGNQVSYLYRKESFLHDLRSCLHKLVLSADNEAYLGRMLFNLNTVATNWDGVFRNCLLLSIMRFGCRVVSNEYEFYEAVDSCSNRSSLYSVDLIGVQRSHPGFYIVTLRICDRYFRILGTEEPYVKIYPKIKGPGASIFEISLEKDLLEADCYIHKLLVIAPRAGEYRLTYEIMFKTDLFTLARIPLPVGLTLRFDSPSPPAGPYKVRRYDFHREVLVHTLRADEVDFGKIYPGNVGVKLPSKWSCKPLSTEIEDAPISYWVCTRFEQGMASLVYMPAGEAGEAGISKSEWEALVSRLAGYEYIQQPIGYSPRKRALFFVPPAHGTLHIYHDRISVVDEDTLETILKWLSRLTKEYHRDFGGAHEALYPWNIFVDSVVLRIGPPRDFLEKVLGVKIPVLDDSKAVLMAKNLLWDKRIRRGEDEVFIILDESSGDREMQFRGLWSKVMELSKFVEEDSPEN